MYLFLFCNISQYIFGATISSPKVLAISEVEINTGLLVRGQWISCWASRICFALAPLSQYNFETLLLSLHGLVFILTTE